MNILLVNDDGIDSPALHVLAKALKDEHELTIIAPDGERSGFSQSMTFKGELDVEEREIIGLEDVNAYATSGTPADCTKLGLLLLCKTPPDLVISGINLGYHIGNDIGYSGTCGAALEASMAGVRAIAASQYMTGPLEFDRAAQFMAGFVKSYMELDIPPEIMVNINFPDVTKPVKGVRVTEQGSIDYGEYYYLVEKHSEKKWTYCLRGRGFIDAHTTGDAEYIKQGYISISPIQYDRTNRSMMEKLRRYHADY